MAKVRVVTKTKIFFDFDDSCQDFFPAADEVGVVIRAQLEVEIAHFFVQTHVGNFWTVVILQRVAKEGASRAVVLPDFLTAPEAIVITVDLENILTGDHLFLLTERQEIVAPDSGANAARAPIGQGAEETLFVNVEHFFQGKVEIFGNLEQQTTFIQVLVALAPRNVAQDAAFELSRAEVLAVRAIFGHFVDLGEDSFVKPVDPNHCQFQVCVHCFSFMRPNYLIQKSVFLRMFPPIVNFALGYFLIKEAFCQILWDFYTFIAAMYF